METTLIANDPLPRAGNDKLWSMLCHLSPLFGAGLVLPLVVYLALKNDSAYAAANAREALNFHISMLIYVLGSIPLAFLVIGIPLLFGLGIASLIFAILATLKVSEGRCYRYPLTLRLV
jgi:uncharacterized Tic20 family protein